MTQFTAARPKHSADIAIHKAGHPGKKKIVRDAFQLKINNKWCHRSRMGIQKVNVSARITASEVNSCGVASR